MTELDLRHLERADWSAATRQYEEHGYVRLNGVHDVVQRLRLVLEDCIGGAEAGDPFDPDRQVIFSPEVRQRLARVPTTRDLATWLLQRLHPVLSRILGPLAHVSSTFHAQFKGGRAAPVDHGGYEPKADYLEVHGAYLLHQDFAGANIPTSPSAVTLWTALNTCPDWQLRLFPGSHRLGLLCHRWLPLDDPRLERIGEPVDIAAEEGSAVLFNALLLHGTGTPGPRRRVSCDIRFFPLCAFLPSEVHLLERDPFGSLSERLEDAAGPTLRAPLLEDLVFLGGNGRCGDVPPLSVLNWVNYVADRLAGRSDDAVGHLRRFVNREFGPDEADIYVSKFHGRPVEHSTLLAVRRQLAAAVPHAPELAGLDRLLQRLTGAPV